MFFTLAFAQVKISLLLLRLSFRNLSITCRTFSLSQHYVRADHCDIVLYSHFIQSCIKGNRLSNKIFKKYKIIVVKPISNNLYNSLQNLKQKLYNCICIFFDMYIFYIYFISLNVRITRHIKLQIEFYSKFRES